jgi:hypothetical protein
VTGAELWSGNVAEWWPAAVAFTVAAVLAILARRDG